NSKNLYYYTESNKKNIKLKKKYLLFHNLKIENSDNFSGTKCIKINVENMKKYTLLKKIYIIRKRYYYTDTICMDIRYNERSLTGTVRAKGEKIIYIVNLL
ncbi:unnamed protein product, partial [marine sediment metagenome]